MDLFKSRSLSLASLAGFLCVLPACDRVRDKVWEFQTARLLKADEKYRKAIEQMAKDDQHIYELRYDLSPDFESSLAGELKEFRRLPDGNYDMMPMLKPAGIEESANTSVVYDPAKRTVTVLVPGPTAGLIEGLFRPFYPQKHRIASEILAAPKR